MGFYETSKQHKETGDEGHTNKTTIKRDGQRRKGHAEGGKYRKETNKGTGRKERNNMENPKSILFGEQSMN